MTDDNDTDDVIETEHTFTLRTSEGQLERPEDPDTEDYAQIAKDSLLIPLVNLVDGQELPDRYAAFEDVLAVSVVIVGRDPDGTLSQRSSRSLDPDLRAQEAVQAIQLVNGELVESAGFPIGIRDTLELQSGFGAGGVGIPVSLEELVGSMDSAPGGSDHGGPTGFM